MVVLCNGCFWVAVVGLGAPTWVCLVLVLVWCVFTVFCLDLLRRARVAILVCGLRVGFSALGWVVICGVMVLVFLVAVRGCCILLLGGFGVSWV